MTATRDIVVGAVAADGTRRWLSAFPTGQTSPKIASNAAGEVVVASPPKGRSTSAAGRSTAGT